jgi:predicted enzyme related to lactoylglutathione lyase
MAAIARFSLVALDTRDPVGLARFYAALTGWRIRPYDHADWIQLEGDGGATIAFQFAPHHEPPRWPTAEHPQQAHLDFDVDDLNSAEQSVLALGAREADVQPSDAYRVFLDPSGHPFCLVRA